MTADSLRGPVDLGLQLERTALAWRRTTLTTVVAALGAARLLANDHPIWQTTAVSLALLTAGAAAYATSRRLHRAAQAMAHHVEIEKGSIPATDDPPPRLPGGGALAIVALGQILAGLLVILLRM